MAARSAEAPRGRLLRAAAAQRTPRAHPSAWRAKWADPAGRFGGRALGRCAPDRLHLFRRQELPQPTGRHRRDRRADSRDSTSRLAGRWTTVGSAGRTMAPSPGGICCSRPRNGRARCSASPTSSIATATSRWKGRAARAMRGRYARRVRFWEYNDVRVNRLALALLRRFGRPLPEVFAERIMRPIGASSDWSWHGYRTSMVEIDGRMIESSVRRQPLGRRHCDPCRGPGAHRPADAASRRVGRAAVAARELDRRSR